MNTLTLKWSVFRSNTRQNMNKYIYTLVLGLLPCINAIADHKESYRVSEADVQNGYILKKVWLDHYRVPDVHISDISYTHDVVLPEDALPSSPDKFDILLGQDRKNSFAVVRIPAYATDEGYQKVKLLSNFTLTVTEKQLPHANNTSASKTTAQASPLASGTWYKISVPNTGLFKIDFNFLSSKLGVDPSKINPSNIRVFGNGGNMLPEDNGIPVRELLEENAIWMNDGGDGSFNQGDYFVFYAVGPTGWTADNGKKRFIHTKNLYEDKSYYFINFDGQGKRISGQQGNLTANTTVKDFNFYTVHHEDLFSFWKSGKTWQGEDFGIDLGRVNERSFPIHVGNVIDSAKFRVSIASRAPAPGNTFNISLNGQSIGDYTLGPAAQNTDDAPFTATTVDWAMPYSGSTANFNLKYKPGINSGIGFLDFIEINTRQPLQFTDPYLLFRDLNSIGAGNVVSYQVGNANGGTQVWDVTDPQNPVRMNGNLNGSVFTFTQDASSLHEFAALNSDQLQVPEFTSTVANQNLQGHEQVDYIIVSYPDFLPAANELANFHRNRSGLRVLVVTPQQIYNEFSSGSQDISAIRNLMKMFYKRAGMSVADMPKYLLLFGDASYDYKDRIPNNTNFVPTFESLETTNLIFSYCNDDFFGFLDDSEYIENDGIINAMDIGVGRLPVKNLTEANAFVNKILQYKSPQSLGPWRLSTTFVSDNEDRAGPHMADGEIMEGVVQGKSNIYNSTKVYLDAIPLISTPGGQRAPDANKMINDQVFKGTFLINYSGHGNIDVLAHERIISQDDYTKWKNIHKLPIMITATCDFGRFDHPEYVSAGERIVLKADGGAIASLTTTQLVYQSPNRLINADFLSAQFEHNGANWNTFGDAFRIGKNATYSQSTNRSVIANFRKFALLGDPALEPNFPEYFIRTDEVLSGATMLPVDTVGALGEYIFKGSVTDVNGNVLDNFNGKLSVTFYDKPKKVKTITTPEQTFNVRNNIIYKGNATVSNGQFSISFIAPKDLNYEFGKGKISYYAQNGITDGAGADTGKIVGGYSDYPVIEYNPPVVRPFIEDSLFKNGGLTGPNTLLFVILEDETGINVSGNSIGHDLTAVLDGDIEHPYVLNDYYETAENTYKLGYVNFPLSNLAEGRHRLTVKAWDVNNNSGEGSVDFEVADGNIVKVRNLMNYPNPFRDLTHFVFEHNHPDEILNVEINIYNTQGTRVKELRQQFLPTGSRSNEITWDGADDNGVKLPSGVYVYRTKISTDKGIHDMAYQKLVIVR